MEVQETPPGRGRRFDIADARDRARVVDAVSGGAPMGLDSRRAVEDAALTLVARSVLTAAYARNETRGCHVRTEFPERDDLRYGFSPAVRLDPAGRPVLRHRPEGQSAA